MVEYVAERYSEFLTKGDVVELFKRLEEVFGTVKDVCKVIGIERKTVYNWKWVKEIRHETKVKILSAALERFAKETLEFLADKGLKRTLEVLSLLLQHIYEKAMETDKKIEFEKFFGEFKRVYEKYDKSLLDALRYEIEELLELLKERARELNVRIISERPSIQPLPYEAERLEYETRQFLLIGSVTAGTVTSERGLVNIESSGMGEPRWGTEQLLRA